MTLTVEILQEPEQVKKKKKKRTFVIPAKERLVSTDMLNGKRNTPEELYLAAVNDGINPFSKAHFNGTVQALLISRNYPLAQRMANEAGFEHVEVVSNGF